MKSKKSESQRDVILGEAIVALLAEQVSVTNAVLLVKLNELLKAEGVTRRKAAIQRVIRDVTSAIAPRTTNNSS
ncbi:hypothetical protein VO451_001393 [Enterobacter hormaechei]|nr:hypothetical protein [Enterobacter hormaechei]